MEKNKQWLALCCLAIEKVLGWGDAAAWRSEDFEQAAEKIFEKTGVQLSLSTLKRIWGRVRYDHFPGPATLNALVQFIDYENWREFCEKHPLHSKDNEEHLILAAEVVSLQPDKISYNPGNNYHVPSFRKTALLIAAAIIIIVTIGFVAAGHYKTLKKINHPYDYKFSSRKTSDDLPNSVVFTYDAGAGSEDKVMIQQSWDSSRRELVDPLGHQYTSIYYYPGYFRAKLLVDDSIVKQTPVFIQTKGWKAIAEKTPLPVYFSDSAMRKKDGISISPEQFATAIGSSDLNNHWVQFSNMREFPGVTGSHFSFQTTLRNITPVEQSLCRKVRLIILGTASPLFIPLSDKGCIADMNLFTGDTLISGKDHDLSALGCDFSKQQDLFVNINNHLLQVSLNGAQILSFPVTTSIGDIVGVRIFFEGGGEISKAMLSASGGVQYNLMER